MEQPELNISEVCPISSNRGFIKTYGPSFLGEFILLFGARMADGCTSGHMMSGMMQGSISGYVFAAAVFVTAIPTALIVKKIKKINRRFIRSFCILFILWIF